MVDPDIYKSDSVSVLASAHITGELVTLVTAVEDESIFGDNIGDQLVTVHFGKLAICENEASYAEQGFIACFIPKWPKSVKTFTDQDSSWLGQLL